MRKSKTLDFAALLLIPAGLYSVWAPFFQLLPEHAADKTWPAHARFHLSWAAGKLLAVGINQIVLALIPFRDGQKWSWFALTSNFVFGALSIVPASRIHMGPLGPFRLHDTSTKLIILSALASMAGLAIGYVELFHKPNPHRRQPERI